jgi:hypothetical protein
MHQGKIGRALQVFAASRATAMHLRHAECCDFATMTLKRAADGRFGSSHFPLPTAGVSPKTGDIGREFLALSGRYRFFRSIWMLLAGSSGS